MDVSVSEIMVPRVLVALPGDKVGYVREIMIGQAIHAIPVVDADDRPLGIVTSSDLLDAPHSAMEVADLMTKQVVTVPCDGSVADAARLMRERRLHHLVVTDDEEIVGIVSSFDLLRVIENNGFRARSRGN